MDVIIASYQSKKFHRHANMLTARFPHRMISSSVFSTFLRANPSIAIVEILVDRRNCYIFARTKFTRSRL